MKRFACFLLALAVFSALPVLAEEPEWDWFESDFGLSFLYDAGEFGVDVSEEGEAVLVYPLALVEEKYEEGLNIVWKDAENQACLCFSNLSAADPEWTKPADWTPPEGFEPLDGDWALPGWIWQHEEDGVVDGPYPNAEIVFEGRDQIYPLFIAYPDGDPDGWGEKMWEILESLEFPPQMAETADFRMDWFQGGAAGMQFIPVTVDEDADPFVIMPLREMRGFVLEQVEWDDETFAPADAAPLYTADPLSPGDNLQGFADFEDICPTLRIRYTDAEGEDVCWYITESGRDGSLMLLGEDEI